MGDINYLENKAEAGKIGGMISGFRRKARQEFFISFLKLIEIEEYPDLNLTYNLAKKILIEFTCGKSISNDMLVCKFSKTGNKIKQKNLDEIASYISQKYRDKFNEMWADAQVQIDIDAKKLKDELLTLMN
ncbi:hypothetical protein N0575_27530 [Pseudomonas aeruginosa]|nr:hypothetical protein [Pseudomonas aeruginosa]MCT1213486.1 hypothetical protein [Pseudomonas aeruginosa]